MQQRIEPVDSLEDFPTMPWGTRALIQEVLHAHAIAPRGICWEPACNRGFMARPLAEYFNRVHATDVHDYGWSGQDDVSDFLFPGTPFDGPVSWVITNPPFRLAQEFIFKAREIAVQGCAMLVRTSFLEGVGRYNDLFSKTPPSIVAQFAERLPMVKGRCDPKASTATSYAWLVWVHGLPPQPFWWIRPCRKQLERPGDYDLSVPTAFGG